ncbi:hypothetical protein D0Y65_010386 [Glycine soja]|uniref:Uncharacterized protein n=1 Tax=Glycine soja TaxID=3848 RepID=A0A445L393_GLYSO|nr:hypothetical protein JHK87_010792 [Glycine soja]RZC17606.1 hypothetical protein D0Y65_010386 [Glycine soja]
MIVSSYRMTSTWFQAATLIFKKLSFEDLVDVKQSFEYRNEGLLYNVRICQWDEDYRCLPRNDIPVIDACSDILVHD